MAERALPLGETTWPASEAPSDLVLGVREVEDLWQIAGWADFEQAAASVLGKLGFSGLGDFRTMQRSGGHRAWRVAPDRLLIEGALDLSDVARGRIAVLDLSHARTAITLSGPRARQILSQMIAIDTAEDTLQPGMFVQTGIHHVGVLITCTGGADFEVLVPFTWAEAVWDTLRTNARPYGPVPDSLIFPKRSGGE